MPWKLLSSLTASPRSSPSSTESALTLVTLRGLEGTSPDEIAFYADAEFDALSAWAISGKFIIAFTAIDRDELTLLCAESVETMENRVRDLPLVAAGLARADIRTVASLRLTGSVAALH